MNGDQPLDTMIATIATLVADVKHLVGSVDRIEKRMEEFALRSELKDYVQRHELDALRTEVRSGSPKSIFQSVTQLAVGLTAIAGLLGLLGTAVLYFSGAGARH